MKEAVVGKVELRVHPPLSYAMSAAKVGAVVLEQVIGPGETLGELLARLARKDSEAWKEIYDPLAGEIRPTIMVFVNGKALSRPVAIQTPLADGDRVAFHVLYGGG